MSLGGRCGRAPCSHRPSRGGAAPSGPGARSFPGLCRLLHPHARARRCGGAAEGARRDAPLRGSAGVCVTEPPRPVLRGCLPGTARGPGLLGSENRGAPRFLCLDSAPRCPAEPRPSPPASGRRRSIAAIGAPGARGHRPGCTAARGRACRGCSHRDGDRQVPLGRPRCRRPAELPPRTGRSPERLFSPRLRPSPRRRRLPVTALCPGPPPLQHPAGRAVVRGSHAAHPAGPGASAERPLPGKSRCRVRSAMTDSARSPSLGRINVKDIQSSCYWRLSRVFSALRYTAENIICPPARIQKKKELS
ncbi:uncharacterized protein LJ206_018145 [Theristicus caerulescens]